MMVVMFSNAALASPQVAQALVRTASISAHDTWQNFRFWWRTSGLADRWSAVGVSLPFLQGAPKGWDGRGAPKRERPAPATPESSANAHTCANTDAGRERPAPATPESREARKRKVAKIRIAPGDVEIEVGVTVVFTAVAYDKDNQPISGLDVSWGGFDEDKKAPLTVAPQAAFTATERGNFKLTAEIGGRTASVKVKVTGEPRVPNLRSSAESTTSSRDPEKPEGKKISSAPPTGNSGLRSAALKFPDRQPKSTLRKSLRAAASALAFSPRPQSGGDFDYTWNSSNYMTADDPGSERGKMPGHPDDQGAGSGNFGLTVPLTSLPGRGLDHNLAL